ncbi:MAG TPA: LptF/LptG family permease [Verrucomicrobiae bacterium]|nr:LptF/LptG family permease [Verrucomicrobiae bacterium]
MRLLDRYLLRELLFWLSLCLGGLLICVVAFSLFSELNKYQEHKLLLSDVVELYLVRIPEILVFVLPIALLIALLYVLTNHARHHELTAIRAAGVSLWRLCAPYLIVGLFLSVALFFMNEHWVPDSAEKEDHIWKRYQEKQPGVAAKDVQINLPFENRRDGHNWLVGAYDFRTDVMTKPQLDWKLPGGTKVLLFAERAERINEVWTFYNVREYEKVPGSEMRQILQTNLLAMPQFSETPGEFKREVKFANRLKQPGAQSTQLTEIPVVEILDYLNLHPDLGSMDKRWLRTQLQGRLAIPWTCLVVVLIAIPFGAASGRRNIFVGVASSIGICFAYFVLLKLGLALGTGGYLPAWLAAWLPNACFGIAGFWMILRVR